STDCCSGYCQFAGDAGTGPGTCGPPPSGSSNCNMPDGVLCGDGMVTADGGIPSCGGGCCSRLCAPYGPTGGPVCPPARRGHPVGDLCTKDVDCCGSAGLPGGSGQPVTCDITPPYAVGVCRNPMGCKPDGDVCRLATMSCNASCDCCSGNCQTQDTCHPDSYGVPRYGPGTCVMPGGACASSASCCNDLPCVPNPVDGGTPPYICYQGACVPNCGKCTTNADCCAGETCILAIGSADGTCGPCGGTSSSSGTTTSSSGTTTSSSGTSTTSSSGMPCATYGQVCTT